MTRATAVAVAVGVAMAASVCMAALPAPMWGGAPDWYSEGNFTQYAKDGSSTTYSMDYYYSSSGAVTHSRWDLGQGQNVLWCSGEGSPGAPCSLINAVDGNSYVYYPAPVNTCCQCSVSYPIQSNWLSGGVFDGIREFNGNKAYTWCKQGGDINCLVTSTTSARVPFQLYTSADPSGPSGKLTPDMVVSFRNVQQAKPPAGQFDVPTTTACDGQCSSFFCNFLRNVTGTNTMSAPSPMFSKRN